MGPWGSLLGLHPPQASLTEQESGGEVRLIPRGLPAWWMVQLPRHVILLTGLQCQPLKQSPALWTWFLD